MVPIKIQIVYQDICIRYISFFFLRDAFVVRRRLGRTASRVNFVGRGLTRDGSGSRKTAHIMPIGVRISLDPLDSCWYTYPIRRSQNWV